MAYVVEHASALADLTSAGVAVTFTRTSPGTYTETTGTWSGAATTTITGRAIQVRGDPQQYAAKELVLSTMPTLLFAPTSYSLSANTSAFVQAGDTVVWAGSTYTVKDVATVAPDGSVIVARIVVAT